MELKLKAKAAIFSAPDAPVEIRDVDVPAPQRSEVLVRMTATGICHTDVSLHRGTLPFPLPAVAGHEGAGTVEAVGDDVSTVKPGDRVVLMSPSCGRCMKCASGHPALCEVTALRWSGGRPDGSAVLTADGSRISGRFLGQSSFCTYALVEERTVIAAPDDISDLILAPFGCGVVTGAGGVLNIFKPAPNSRLVVLGAGAVGLSAVMAAALTPATDIVAVDIVASRLDLAKEIGATAVVNGGQTADLAGAIKDLTGGGADYILDTTGNVTVLRSAFAALARGGTLGLIGAPSPEVEFSVPVMQLISGAHNLRGIVMGDGSASFIRRLMRLHLEGRFPVDRLVTSYPFEQIAQAMADAECGRVVKPVLTF